MEVCIAHIDNVPEGCMLALTCGSSRRLAPLAARQKFAFGGPAALAAAADGGAGIKLEVLQIQGSTRVDASKLTAGVLGKNDGPPKAQRFEVPLKLLNGTMRVGLTVRAAPAEGARGGREAHRLARMASPDSEKEALMSVKTLKKKQRLIPMDDLEASAGEGVPANSPSRKGGRHNVALEARTYLEEHRILPFVEEMMRILVKERPQDPWDCISALFPAKAPEKPKARQEQPAPPKEAPAMLQREVPTKLMPSVGTWYMPLKKKLAAVPEAAVPEAAVQEVPKPQATIKERQRSASPVRSRRDLTQVGFHKPGPAASPFTTFAAVEFTIENLVYKDIAKNYGLARAMIEKVQHVLASRLGVKVSTIEVELGSGSLVVGSKIRVFSEQVAEDLKFKVESDRKGLMLEVESALMEIKGLDSVIKPTKGKTGTALGARSLRAFVRQKLTVDEAAGPRGDPRATGSTFAPTAGASMLAGITSDSWGSYEDGEQSMLTGEQTMLGPLEEIEEREIELSQDVVTSGAQVLRKVARDQLVNAKKKGLLLQALETMRAQRGEKLKHSFKETLLLALRSGTLGASLNSAEDVREEQRMKVRSRIFLGIEDGSLEAALHKALGRPGEADEEDGGQSEVGIPGEPMSPSKLRQKVKDTLLQASLKRSLAPALNEWFAEKDALIRNPRPVPMEPFGAYMTNHFKWGLEEDMRGLFNSFATARKAAKEREEEEAEPPPPPPKSVLQEEEEEEQAMAAKRLRPMATGDSPLDQFSHVIAAHFAQINKPGRKRKPKAKAEAKAPLPIVPEEKEAPPAEEPPSPPPTYEEVRPSSANTDATARGAEAAATSEAQQLIEDASLGFLASSRAFSTVALESEISARGQQMLEEAMHPPKEPEPVKPEPMQCSWNFRPSAGAWAGIPRPFEPEAEEPEVDDSDDEAEELVMSAADEASMDLAAEGLSVEMSFKNMDYNALKADKEMWDAFIWETKKTLAAQAGEGVLPEHIILDLESGSVIIKAKIVPPASVNLANLSAGMENVGAALVKNVCANVPGVESVASGPLEVTAPKVEKVDTAPLMKLAKKQVKTAVKKRVAEEKESAKVVDGELIKQEEERKRKAAEDAEQQKKFEQEVEEELRKPKEASEEAERKRKAEEDKMLEEELRRKQLEDEEQAKLRAQAEAEEAERQRIADEIARQEADAAQKLVEEEQVVRLLARRQEAEAAQKLIEEEEAAAREELERQQREKELAARLKAKEEEEHRKKDAEIKQVAESLQKFAPLQQEEQALPVAKTAAKPEDSQPSMSQSDGLEDICIGDRVEVIHSLYVGQDGMEVLAGWQGSVEELNDGDVVILFYGMDEGRYVLREDFGNLIVMKADSSVSSSSADMLANACSEAVTQNEQLRAQNAALRVELDRLLALATPMSTPPLTGASIPRTDFGRMHSPGLDTPMMTPPYAASNVSNTARQVLESGLATPPLTTPSRQVTEAGLATPPLTTPSRQFGASIGTPSIPAASVLLTPPWPQPKSPSVVTPPLEDN